MDEFQKETITKLVYAFARRANITDQDQIQATINKLCSMNISDSIDAILVSLGDLLDKKIITEEDILANIEAIIKLDPEQYKSVNDLIARLNWIKSMNMEHPDVPLTENHRLIIDVFDKFNALIGSRFDCYYTGGIMGYLATNRTLERYHDDLDLFINEQQLATLKELVDSSTDFEFISNMAHKEAVGHEYKIAYKETPMSIGLFLFERQPDGSITTKEYYFENQNGNKQLFVNEYHLSKDYTKMSFSDLVRHHNGNPYRMMSLESIYNLKKNSRPKDRHDAGIIKNDVDMAIDCKLDAERKNNFTINHKPVAESAVHRVEEIMRGQNNHNKTSIKT